MHPYVQARMSAWTIAVSIQYGQWDLNPHSLRNRNLNPARLPVSPWPCDPGTESVIRCRNKQYSMVLTAEEGEDACAG